MKQPALLPTTDYIVISKSKSVLWGLPWNGAISISGFISIYTNFITAIAERTKIIKLNHLHLYDIQTDHI